MRLSPTADALAEARERTLALVAPFSDADVEAQHNAIMSPLVWDLAHIAAYEELWLVHRHGGLPLSRPDLAAMYERVRVADSFLHDLVVRHEDQHQETMLQAIARGRLSPAPAVPRPARPA